MRDWYSIDGAPGPLGATWMTDEQAWNFALYSRHASQATLLLYAADNLTTPIRELRLDYTRQKTGRVWHCHVVKADVPLARYYAYRVEGSFSAAEGRRRQAAPSSRFGERGTNLDARRAGPAAHAAGHLVG